MLMSHLRELFAQRMATQNPMVGMFLQGPLLQQIKDSLSAQMAERFPEFMERIVGRVEHRLDVSEIVKRKIEGFDLSKLESLIYEISARELRTIEILGGVLGFIVGSERMANFFGFIWGTHPFWSEFEGWLYEHETASAFLGFGVVALVVGAFWYAFR